MNLLARFRPVPDVPTNNDDVPVRRRTFSAAAYREEELSRAAAARAVHEEAEAVSRAAADALRAARMADVKEDAAEPDEAGPGLGLDPMDWDEACGWLSTRSSEARSYVAQQWNWEQDLRVLQFLVAQPDMDLGVAAGIFWLTGATDDFFPWSEDSEPSDEQFKRAADMVEQLGLRFAAEDFNSARFGFDDSWDCGQLKERLEALYLEGRIEWSPANLPTVSPGPQPTLEDVPAEERAELIEFLTRHGC